MPVSMGVGSRRGAGASASWPMGHRGQQVTTGATRTAPGATYRRTGAPGEDDLIGSGVHFCATCDGPFYKGAAELVVLGAGPAHAAGATHRGAGGL